MAAGRHENEDGPAGPVDLRRSPHAKLRPLGLHDAAITGGFLADRQGLNRERLIPEGHERLEEAGNFHDLRVAAGREEGEFRGLVFMDSDVHKWLEAVGWELAREPSATLAALADDVIGLLEAAQEDDGYLNSYYQVVAPRPRFTNLSWDHELYCAGHLIQAAVAHARARGDERLLGVARRLADHIDERFGDGGDRDGPPGHPEIETALVELARLTGEPRYRERAQYFVDVRGRRELPDARFGSGYFQDRVPVREAAEVEGHCVRALYLAAGVVDLHLETGEAELLAAMERWWADMAGRKAYLTGGLGAHHTDEAFGDPYELPPDRCYGETCAAIASVQWNWRMLLATGEARYADLLECTLYNGFLAGLALDGGGYSYVNPLQVRESHRDTGERGALRHPWYACACCPPNVMRLLASLGHYLATSDDSGLQVHQYATSRLRAGDIAVQVETDYPWSGRVVLEVTDAPADEWTLALRIPAWSAGARVTVAGEDAPVEHTGYVRIRRTWEAGEKVVLELPLDPRIVAPHPRIDAVRGQVAIERGPLVYCLEGVDLPDEVSLDDVRIDRDVPLGDAPQEDLLGGVVTVRLEGEHVPPDGWPGEWPYQDAAGGADGGRGPVQLAAVPYALWGNRGEGTMRVWVPAR